jgi:hypothetical protein
MVEVFARRWASTFAETAITLAASSVFVGWIRGINDGADESALEEIKAELEARPKGA